MSVAEVAWGRGAERGEASLVAGCPDLVQEPELYPKSWGEPCRTVKEREHFIRGRGAEASARSGRTADKSSATAGGKEGRWVPSRRPTTNQTWAMREREEKSPGELAGNNW